MSARLRLNITDSQTTIDILDTSNFPVDGGVIQIASEKISYTRATSQGVTGCTRGYDGSSAASHLAGLVVSLLTTVMNTDSPLEFNAAGSPTDNLTGVKIAPTGSHYTNTTTGDEYINTGSSDEPTWSLLSTNDTSAVWGSITGDIADQTDLQDALDDATTPPGGTTGQLQYNDGSGGFAGSHVVFKTVGGNTDQLNVNNTGGYEINFQTTDGLSQVGQVSMNIAQQNMLISAVNDVRLLPGYGAIGPWAFDKHGAVKLPSVTVAQRDAMTPAAGMVIYNSDTAGIEVYDGSHWQNFGAFMTVNDNTANISLNNGAGTNLGSIFIDNTTSPKQFGVQSNGAVLFLIPQGTNSGVEVGGSAKDNSAIFQIDNENLGAGSTPQGFLPPRLTTTERDAIVSPAEGLVVYNTTTHVLNFYNGTTWGAV